MISWVAKNKDCKILREGKKCLKSIIAADFIRCDKEHLRVSLQEYILKENRK